MTNLPDLGLREVGGLLRSGAATAVDLVEATLTRIAATEPRLHAYVRVLAAEARAEASQRDAELAAGRDRGPLHGIPVAVKDLCDLRGTSTEAGSPALAGAVPAAADAAVVERLRAAGAVVIGKTVTHELAYGVNEPPTRCAWGDDCYPGGSSAGSGVAVAAGSAFAAIGTDTGGSIREPAALNGLVGLKPTFGLVSRVGITPLSPSLDHAGPLVRTTDDCALLLEAIAGYDPRDSGSRSVPVPSYAATLEEGIAGLIVGVDQGLLTGAAVSAEVRAAVEAALTYLEGQGAIVRSVRVPHHALMRTVGLTTMLVDGSGYHGHLLKEHGAELARSTRLLVELGALIPATDYLAAQRARRILCEEMRDLFEAHGLSALASPTLPTTTMSMQAVNEPDAHGETPLATALDFLFAANVTGQPALTVPCGFSSAGLPIGLHLLGRPFDEATLLRLARRYERGHDWAQRRPSAS